MFLIYFLDRIKLVLFLISFHILLDILGVVWDSLFSEEAATIFGYEEVVLDADTTKVLVGFQEIIVDEILAMAF